MQWMKWELTGNAGATYLFEYHSEIKGAALHEQTKLAAWAKERGIEDVVHCIGRYIRPTKPRNAEAGQAGKGRVCFRLLLIFTTNEVATLFKLTYL